MPDKDINVSVRNMVEFILRQGSIDYGYSSASRAQDGTRIHQKIQKKRARHAARHDYLYKKEVYLKYSFKYSNFNFQVEGRADGVIRDKDYVAVEEIKSTAMPVDQIERNEDHWHWAQAKCYAFILAENEELEEIKIILTYCHIETEEEAGFERVFKKQELHGFFFDLIAKYFKWAEMDYTRKLERNSSIKKLKFPYGEYRKGQRNFAVSVYRAIQHGKKLFAQAPTGTGKTMSTLFPSVKSMGEGLVSKIFYLTAKTITRQTAQQSVALIKQKGCGLLSVTLTAKDKICLSSNGGCNPVDCIYADGHFDRVNDAVWDILINSAEMNREDIQFYADKHKVCPHEFSLDITLWADLIICDYNYVFDPKVQLKRFFSDNAPKGEYLFLVDESHNLVDRSREMYSKQISKREYSTLRKLVKDKNNKLYRILGKINTYLLALRKEHFTDVSTNAIAVKEAPDDLSFLFREFCAEMDMALAMNAYGMDEIFEDAMELYFSTLDYLKILDYYNEKYVFFMQNSRSDFTVKLLCLDPSEILAEIQKKAVATVFFSATLTPIKYFMNVFGGEREDYGLKIASPFDPNHLCLIIENTISTKYKSRQYSYDRIAECLHQMCSAKMGNYFAFFPSYEYLMKVYEIFIQKYDSINVIIQNQRMSEDEREQFLINFDIEPSHKEDASMLAFAVMGGIFSEGIDLKGEKLLGTAVIGVGLPLITYERNLISNYYDDEEFGGYNDYDSVGFEYAYVYPGMNKVMQSAGRVIRTEKDKGVVILIDERFSSNRYLELFPPEWEHYIKASEISSLDEVLAEFWSE